MKPANDTLLIPPCRGTSPHGCLVARASQELVLEAKAQWLTPEMLEHLVQTNLSDNEKARVIVVDGCDKECGLQEHKKYSVTPEFHLSLEDIGIDSENEVYDEEALQLVKDAILAVSTRPTEAIPMIPGCCC